MNYYIIVISLVVAIGGFVYGVDSGIIATTLGHSTFAAYMYGPNGENASLTGAIVALYNVGQALGTFITGYSADKFSRRWTLCASGMIASFGAALQSAAQDVGMMIAGRFFAGLGCGIILSVVPVYISEVSPPKNRGFIVGMQGMMIAIGFMMANWIGYAGSFAKGNAQWRIPLGMQIPGTLLLSIGCCFIPYSPRWLIETERFDEAKIVLNRLHAEQGEAFIAKEFTQIRSQIMLERPIYDNSILSAVTHLFSRQYARRTALACFIVAMSQLSGSLVIQNYQSIFYASVGFTGQTSLLISGVYGLMGVFGQLTYLVVVADKWKRTTTMWVGSIFLAVMVSILMALSAEFPAGTTNLAGPRAAIACIFIYSFGFAVFFNAMIWVLPSEMFPFFLRSKGLGLAVFCNAVSAIVLSQISPIAIQNVGWRYYALFIATNLVAGLIYFLYLPETKGKSLEEIAALFGDKVATESLDNIDIVEEKDTEARGAKHVESV